MPTGSGIARGAIEQVKVVQCKQFFTLSACTKKVPGVMSPSKLFVSCAGVQRGHSVTPEC
jgi:hypothetical protein